MHDRTTQKKADTMLTSFQSPHHRVRPMWNERYSASHYIYGTEPNDFLREHAGMLAPGSRVLCLAEGEGRNAVFLAQQGHKVVAVDLSEVGLAKAAALAAARGVLIDCLHADLADFDLGQERWDGIISIFCHLPSAVRQPLYARLAAALRPEGVLLLEGYTPAQLTFGTGGPKDVDMLVDAATLRRELPHLQFSLLQDVQREVVEGTLHTGMAAVVQAVARRR
jgi:SAM-dependent methyltransferase